MNKAALPLQILLFLFLIHSLPVSADQEPSINDFFNEQEIEKVTAGNIITYAHLAGSKSISTELITQPVKIPGNKFTAGTDFSAYEMIAIEKAFLPYSLETKSLLGLYKRLVSFSSLSGTDYYSRSEGKVKPFILESFHVPSATDTAPIEDPLYDDIQPKRTHYFRIKDNRFGWLTFRNEIHNTGNNFVMKNVSETQMKKFFTQINNQGEYQLIYYFFYDELRKGYFYYALNAMRIRRNPFFGMDILSAENFANRIRAVTVKTARLIGLDWEERINPFQ